MPFLHIFLPINDSLQQHFFNVNFFQNKYCLYKGVSLYKKLPFSQIWLFVKVKIISERHIIIFVTGQTLS